MQSVYSNRTARSILHCGKHCAHENSSCNVFHYNKTGKWLENVWNINKIIKNIIINEGTIAG